jgi:hypothetical protein
VKYTATFDGRWTDESIIVRRRPDLLAHPKPSKPATAPIVMIPCPLFITGADLFGSWPAHPPAPHQPLEGLRVNFGDRRGAANVAAGGAQDTREILAIELGAGVAERHWARQGGTGFEVVGFEIHHGALNQQVLYRSISLLNWLKFRHGAERLGSARAGLLPISSI